MHVQLLYARCQKAIQYGRLSTWVPEITRRYTTCATIKHAVRQGWVAEVPQQHFTAALGKV